MSATPVMLSEPQGDVESLLPNAPLFQDVAHAAVKAAAECSELRRYASGQTVYSMGQYDGSEFFVVLSGRMRVSLADIETGSMIIEEFSAGQVFALELVFGGVEQDIVQKISITAEDNLALAAIDIEVFKGIAASRPTLMRNIAAHLANDLAARRFKNTTLETAPEQRVFAALLKFVERDRESGEWRVPRMPKHRELADEAGVEEAVTASAVAMLIQEGVARRDYPGLLINDMGRLNQLAS